MEKIEKRLKVNKEKDNIKIILLMRNKVKYNIKPIKI